MPRHAHARLDLVVASPSTRGNEAFGPLTFPAGRRAAATLP